MKTIITFLAALILLSLGAAPSLAQYYDGYGDGYYEEYYDEYEEGYTCWACPVCSFVVSLDVEVDESAIEYHTTLGEVADLNPYDPEDYCPYCDTYGAYFVLVPCSDYYEDDEEYGDFEYYDYEDGEYYEEDENGEYYEEECEEEHFDDEEVEDEWANCEEYSDTHEEYEETEYAETVETGDEFDEAGEIDDNETESAAGPVIGDEETVDSTAPVSIETPIEEARKILIVIPSKDFNDAEFTASETRFFEEGFEVNVASEGTEDAVGMDGSSAAVDLEVADAEVSDYEAVVFIGGPGVDDLELYDDPDYLDLASSAQYLDLVVGAICVAPKILANAEILEGRNATVFPDSESIAYIESKGATYSDEQVVRDGKIITACGPEASEEFAEAVVAAVKEGQA